jgi:hypothetical protein
MGEKRNQEREKCRKIRQHIMFAVSSFDTPIHPATHKPLSKFETNYHDQDDNYLRKFTNLREYKTPQLLKYLVSRKRLSQEKSDTLTSMLNSSNREDWYMAFLLTIQITNPKFLTKPK